MIQIRSIRRRLDDKRFRLVEPVVLSLVCLLTLWPFCARSIQATQNQTVKQMMSEALFINSNNETINSSIPPDNPNATARDPAILAARLELRQQKQALKNSSHVLPAFLSAGAPAPRQIVSSSKPADNNNQAAGTSARTLRASGVSANLSSVRQHWRHMESSISQSLNSIGDQLRQTLDELPASQQHQTVVSAECRKSLYELAEGLAAPTPKLWASQIYDASAKLPSGMLEGTLTELGHLDQCLEVSYQSEWLPTTRGEGLTSGQYCSLLIKPHLTMRPRFHTVCQRLGAPLSTSGLGATINGTQIAAAWSPFKLLSQNSHHFYYAGLRLGICTPSKCSRSDVQILLTSYLNKYQLIGQVKSCQFRPDEKPRFDFVQQCIMSTFAALLLLNLLGTLIDLCASKRIDTTARKGTMRHRNMKLGLEQQQAAGGQQDRVQGKRCHYQVYRLDSDLMGSDSSHSLATQLNPISEAASFAIVSGDRPPRAKDHPRLPDEFTRNAAQPDDEEWISRLEMNQTAEHQNERPPPAGSGDSSSWLRELLLCFSIRRSLQVIGKHATALPGAKDQGSHSMDDIQVIHGLRTIAMFWIIFGHTIGLVSPDMMNKLFSLAQLSCTSRFLQALLNATLAVNTFFMISGLVTVLSLARKCRSCHALLSAGSSDDKPDKTRAAANRDPESTSVDSTSVISSLGSSASSRNRCIHEGGKRRAKKPKSAKRGGGRAADQSSADFPSDFKPFLWLAMRYLRLTPSYAAIIGLSILMPALGSGPFWQETVGQMGPVCRQGWWLNLLYLNNFIDTDRLCLIHSWYLSNDWQFFSLTLLLFALFHKSKKLTLLLIVCLGAASSATTFSITVTNNFPPTIVSTSPAVAERWLFIHSLYYKPWPHLGSYLVGLLTGYCILIKDRLRISSKWRIGIWFSSTLMALTLLNSIYPWNMGLQVEPLLTGLHSATFRTLWALCCAWLVFGLVTRPTNPLARLLSWHGFQVTSRLTFCTYLVHPLIIFYHFGTMNERIDSSVYGQFHRFMATATLSYLAALLLSILVESPSVQVQQLLAGLGSPRTRRSGTGSAEEHTRGQLGERRTSSSGGSATEEWSPSSSFSEPAPVVGAARTLAGSCEQLKHPPDRKPNQRADTLSELAVEQVPIRFSCPAGALNPCQKHSCSEQQSVEINRKPMRRSFQDDEPASSESSIGLDADFQEKLAQAISRGFRIRSKLANGTIRQAGVHPAPVKANLPGAHWDRPAHSEGEQRSRPASRICQQGARSELSTFRQHQHQHLEAAARGARPKPPRIPPDPAPVDTRMQQAARALPELPPTRAE